MAVGDGGLAPAVFFDKDGTLVHDLPYNVDPRRLVLRADAGPALARLQAAGWLLLVVSNQPGLGEGRFDEAALAAVWLELNRQLAGHGVGLCGVYWCPHAPATACTCRKPQPGLLRRAAIEHRLDLARSWLVGDILDDIEAGRRAGCRTVLLDVGNETQWQGGPLRQPDFTCASLADAAGRILAGT